MFSQHRHFRNPNSQFNEIYKCFSIGMLNGPERPQVANGGKVILPPSALAKLTQLNIEYPMLFELCTSATTSQRGISNAPEPDQNIKKTHAGVLEFIAEEGRVYVPFWMLKTLGLKEGSYLSVKSTSLPLGKYVKIQPQSASFLEISDPRAVLEQSFRNFSALTTGDVFSIMYNDSTFDILVMETKPSPTGISVIETDLEVDFAAPLGYVEPDYKANKKPAAFTPSSIDSHVTPDAAPFQPFQGGGSRLNGKATSLAYGHADINGVEVTKTGIAQRLVLPEGKLFFGYPLVPLKKDEAESKESFTGSGQSLRKSKQKP